MISDTFGHRVIRLLADDQIVDEKQNAGFRVDVTHFGFQRATDDQILIAARRFVLRYRALRRNGAPSVFN